MEIDKKTYWKIFGGILLCIVVYWLLHETERVKMAVSAVLTVASPFITGAALAFVLNVPVRAIEGKLKGVPSHGGRRALAILLSLLCCVLVIAVVFLLLIPQIAKTVESLVAAVPEFITRCEDYVNKLIEEHPEEYEAILKYTELETFDLGTFLTNIWKKAESGITDALSHAFGAVTSAIGNVTGALVNAIISLVFSFYCLSAKEDLTRQGKSILYAFLPEKTADEIVRILRMTGNTFSSFISGQCLEAVILGCMFAVAMWITGMPYVPLVSVLVAVTALVPVVGAFVGCVFGAFFILVDNPIQAAWFVALFLLLQQIENNLVYPKVVGTSIGLPGIWVLMAVTIGGDMMGVAGMLIMIPMASVMYALLREVTYKKLNNKSIDMEKINGIHEPEPGLAILDRLKNIFAKKLKK